jgi:hypothetical protein
MAKVAKIAKDAKATGPSVKGMFAGNRPVRGDTKNLGSEARYSGSAEILRLRAQNDTLVT